MLCDKCKKNEATINFTQVTNDKKIEYHLCEDCAEKLGFKNPLKAVPFPLGTAPTASKSTSPRPASEERLSLRTWV